VVVVRLPGPQADRGRLEVLEAAPPPEFLLIDAAALDLAILLRPARLDVVVADPERLNGEREREGELLPIVALQPTDAEGKRSTELGEKSEV